MRKRPEIPEDVFFDTDSAREDEPSAEVASDEVSSDEVSSDEEQRPDGGEPETGEQSATGESGQPRVGRPPAQEGPKVAVTLYLTEPVAQRLEEVKFLLLSEYGVRTSKSAIADFALRNGLDDLEAAAEDLRRNGERQ